MQFSIIVIDMDSGVYDTHYFEIKPMQILLYISLIIMYLKLKYILKVNQTHFL